MNTLWKTHPRACTFYFSDGPCILIFVMHAHSPTHLPVYLPASGAACIRRLLCIRSLLQQEAPLYQERASCIRRALCHEPHHCFSNIFSLRFCWYCKQYSYWGKGVCETPSCRLNKHGGGGKNKGIKRRLRGEVHRATALRGEELKVATQQAAAQQAAEPPA